MDEKLNEILFKPYKHILQTSGKQFRTQLINAVNVWLRIPENHLKVICDVTEMLHNSSLLIDDIEDSSMLRRGIPAAHTVFGVATTLNSANYMYFLCLDEISKRLPQSVLSDAAKIYTEQLLELHKGQGMDIYWRDEFVCPTEEEYFVMIDRKTGGLFGLSIRLMQLFTDDKCDDYLNVVKTIGKLFQVNDDYINLTSTEYHDKKGFAEDISEGKFSFPMIHAIKSNPNDNTLMEIICKRPEDIETKKQAIELMKRYGSLDYTLNVIKDLELKARNDINKLGGNKYLIMALEKLLKI